MAHLLVNKYLSPSNDDEYLIKYEHLQDITQRISKAQWELID